MRYRKRPIEVEAIQYTGDNYKEICDFCQSDVNICDRGLLLHIHGSSSYIEVNDYIYKDKYGLNICYCDIFEDLYEPIPEDKFTTPYTSKIYEKLKNLSRL